MLFVYTNTFEGTLLQDFKFDLGVLWCWWTVVLHWNSKRSCRSQRKCLEMSTNRHLYCRVHEHKKRGIITFIWFNKKQNKLESNKINSVLIKFLKVASKQRSLRTFDVPLNVFVIINLCCTADWRSAYNVWNDSESYLSISNSLFSERILLR